MAKRLYGSLNLTEILKNAKEKHHAFSKHENGNIYFNVDIWLNDEPDKFGNNAAMQLNKKPDEEKAIYIGNFKYSTPKENPIESTDIIESDDLPF